MGSGQIAVLSAIPFTTVAPGRTAMRRNSHVARTVALGIIADDIYGALMNAPSIGHENIPPAWLLANRPKAPVAELRLPAAGPDDVMRWNIADRVH